MEIRIGPPPKNSKARDWVIYVLALCTLLLFALTNLVWALNYLWKFIAG